MMRFRLFIFFNLFLIPVFGQLDIVLQTGNKGLIESLSFHKSKKFLISNDSESVVIWDLKSRKQFGAVYSEYGVVNSGFVGEESFYVAYPNEIIIYNIQTQKKENSYPSENKIRQVEAFDNKVYCLSDNLVKIDLNANKPEVIKDSLQDVKSFSLSSKGEKVALLYISTPRKLKVISKPIEVFSTKEINKSLFLDFHYQNKIYIDDQSSLITITNEQNSIFTYELKNEKLKLLHVNNNSNSTGSYTLSEIFSNSCIVGDKNGFLNLYNTESGKVIANRKNKSGKVSALTVNADQSVIAAGGEQGIIQLYDAQLENNLHTFKAISPAATCIKAIPNRAAFLIGFDNGDIKLWDISNQKISSIKGDNVGRFDEFSNVKTTIETLDLKGGVYRKTAVGKKPVFKRFFFNDEMTSFSSEKMKKKEKLTFLNEQKEKTNGKSAGTFLSDGRNVIGKLDGFIYLLDKDSTELLKMVSPIDNSFFYLTPENYYFASKNALPFVGARLNNNLIGFEQVDLVFNRPDKVLKILSPELDDEYFTLLEDAYEKRLSKLGLSVEDLLVFENLPRLKSNLSELPLKSKNREIEVELELSSTVSLSSLHILVNGVPILGKNGKKINGKSLSYSEKIFLTEGQNNIQIYVENESGLTSIRDKGTVNYSGSYEPSLYILSIGSGKFNNPKYDLNFAAKDATDVVEEFTSHNSKLFKSVHSSILTGEKVSKKAVFEEISKLKDVNEDDVIIVFFAGHGTLDENLDYYLSAYPMNFKKPSEGGISFDEFENQLSLLKSRNKLLLIDACHSGEVDKDEFISGSKDTSIQENQLLVFRSGESNFSQVEGKSAFELSKNIFTDLRKTSGIITISSAGAAEYALEGGQWKNGAFTFCLLKGLSEMAADLNFDKKIDVNELQQFLFVEVPKLTDGRQTPRSRVEIREQNFPIW